MAPSPRKTSIYYDRDTVQMRGVCSDAELPSIPQILGEHNDTLNGLCGSVHDLLYRVRGDIPEEAFSPEANDDCAMGQLRTQGNHIRSLQRMVEDLRAYF